MFYYEVATVLYTLGFYILGSVAHRSDEGLTGLASLAGCHSLNTIYSHYTTASQSGDIVNPFPCGTFVVIAKSLSGY